MVILVVVMNRLYTIVRVVFITRQCAMKVRRNSSYTFFSTDLPGKLVHSHIRTIQRNSVHWVIGGIIKRPIPMTQITVDVINQQAKQEGQPDGIIFRDIDGRTTLDDLEVAPGK